ncbi:hypothetical protein H696_00435 [Fonticula alba]|uniref:glutamine--tRNA ligase n=1 Tax=Fonticula alba TaxID=691883 RepID=A0A058ZHA3_FONAL|nr:hypothetical protein H696_00435 [Fonticula alba]KCV72862.1 hypothetical protein H696_00435 [Fonticula alba]|eukprot:XP_009492563.1 hypothetical protein H696_00435 [Fonticula alba]
MTTDSDMAKLFSRIGLDDTKALETTKNPQLSACLKDMIFKDLGKLIYKAATRVSKDLARHQDLFVNYIVTGKLKTSQQLDAAFEFMATQAVDAVIDLDGFDLACGVGVVITPNQIEAAVAAVLNANKKQLDERRYRVPAGLLISQILTKIRWANMDLVTAELNKQLLEMLGPKTEADLAEPKKQAKVKKPKQPVEKAAEADSPKMRTFTGDVLKLHKPGENPQIDPKLMEQHLAFTKGKVFTRFPPEPNGFLHIGHAKAMNFNFRYAELHGGNCYLRFDDTNPDAEEPIYFESIEKCVNWLGFQPYKVTATSDYFDELWDLAIRAIKNDKAYICHQTAEEIHQSRGGADNKGPRTESPWRNRPIEESLKLFHDMRDGKFAPGEATLRLKMDMNSGNPYLWDPVAYRVLHTRPHVRTGTKWIVYPTYDFSHCLIDSIENISHSFCTVEFQTARESYYWVCDAVEVYKPVQWEYGRLNITHMIMSKRKLNRLVDGGFVNGWDDPRLLTIEGMRRRGYTPDAINNFCELLGITTSNTIVEMALLENVVRDDLNKHATRAKVVLDPIKVIITNYEEGKIEDISYPKLPHDESAGMNVVPFCRTLFIDRSDFRETFSSPEEQANFFRLTPGGSVGLQRAYVITCDKVVHCPETGDIQHIECSYKPNSLSADFPRAERPKAYIHWVADCPARGSPITIDAHLYSPLFQTSNPEDNPEGFLADLNPDSLQVVKGALADISIAGAQPEDKFQFERVGFFCLDRESAPVGSGTATPVFNRTVGLKESSRKV